MKVLVVGSGGREHAGLEAETKCRRGRSNSAVYAGTQQELVSETSTSTTDTAGLITLCSGEQFTVVGPEVPLVAGMSTHLSKPIWPVWSNGECCSPRRPKAFSKDFMQRYGIPTAAHEISRCRCREGLCSIRVPIVIEADSRRLVRVLSLRSRKRRRLTPSTTCLVAMAGEAGRRVVVEESCPRRASFIWCDGTGQPFASSQDHKARDDGDQARIRVVWVPIRQLQ